MSMQCPPGTFAYVIRSGDTFYSLAQRFNTTVNALLLANPGVNPNALQIGQTICIPGAQPPPATCPAGSTPYVIKSGDTLYALAAQFNTTVTAIIAVNPGINPNTLQIGQTICIPGAQPPATCPTGSTPYVIKSGDTLYTLAQRYNTTVPAIIALNPGINPNALQIGQTICIPGTQPPPSRCPAGTFSYIVRPGDTLGQIGQRFNVSLEAIVAVNPGIDPSRLQAGMTLCIPLPGTCPGGRSYTIQPGDTFYSIARKFNVSLDALLAANPYTNPAQLYVGQKICIPINCPGNKSYVILPGETLVSVAEKFVVRVSDLLAANPGLRPSDFVPGTRVCIPLEQAPV